MRVLRIEDDPMVGEFIHQAFKSVSYAADWIRKGQVALDTLQNLHYNFVLLDLGLPGKSGLDILRAIRSKDNPVRLLIITAQNGLDERILGLDTGADDYLPKPFAMADLLVRDWFRTWFDHCEIHSDSDGWED